MCLLLVIDTRDELQIEREFFFWLLSAGGAPFLHAAPTETKRAKMSDKFFKGRILDFPRAALAVIQPSEADPLPSYYYTLFLHIYACVYVWEF